MNLYAVVVSVLVIRESNDDDRTDAVVHTVVTNTAEPSIGAPPRGSEAPAAHNDGDQTKPLDLQAEPLLQVVILHDVDLERDLGLAERLGEVVGFGDGEAVEIGLEFLLGGLVGRDGDVGGAPVGAVEDGGGADVEEDDGIAGAEVVLDGPGDGEGALVAEVDGDADAALGTGGGGAGGREARGGGLDDDRGGGVVALWF